MRYRKSEEREQIRQRHRKEMENVTLSVIGQILRSEHMKETFEAALDCSREEGYKPVTIQDFTRLRDVLILKFMMVSLKRAMEFSEFTLGEYSEIERREHPKDGESYVIRVTNHKTARQGRSQIIYLPFVLNVYRGIECKSVLRLTCLFQAQP